MNTPTPVPRPLLLCDIDGPLNPDRYTVRRQLPPLPEHYTTHKIRSGGLADVKGATGRTVYLSSVHATALQTLRTRFTLIWATTWQEEANRHISPLLGLPTDIPVIEWPLHVLDNPQPVDGNGSWKTPYIAQWLDDYARGLPWAWFDDDLTAADTAWFERWYETHPPAPHLLLSIPSREGLGTNHFDQLHDFATHQSNSRT